MTDSRRGSALAVAALLFSTLVACSSATSGTTSTPSSQPTTSPTTSTSMTSDPVTDSDRAGQAAAGAVHDYFATIDRLRQDRSWPMAQLKTVATGGQLAAQEVFTRSQRRDGNRQVGDTKVVDVVVQQVQLDSSEDGHTPTVQLDVCWDVGAVDVLGSDGKSIVSPDRQDRGWTRYTLVNRTWPSRSESGWRISNGQDLEKAPCSAG